LSRTVLASPDNIFGEFTQSITCPIELGERAPVVISVSPSGGSCSIGQNLLVPGSCFIRADGTPNVTSVFAVDRNDPNHIIQSSKWQILNPNLIDAFFEFGSANAGKTFLIFVSGPNGTSRDLTLLPAGADPSCPIGNEQGIVVTFACATGVPPPPPPPPPPTDPVSILMTCSVQRSSSGVNSLVIRSIGIGGDARITLSGVAIKKTKFSEPADEPNTFRKVTLKGKVCQQLPGAIDITYPDNSRPPFRFNCVERCDP